MKYYIKGGNKTVNLSNYDFMASGGEASIYSYGSKVCKIFHSPQKMIPELKIQELSNLTKNNIIKPIDILSDQNGMNIGFTMEKISGVHLCKLFINSIKIKNNISQNDILDILKKMIDTIKHIHKNKCLMVDGNELSYLVNKGIVYFIDVNSYKTISYPPTAIMPTIKDFHSNYFSELTDWFSFGIVSFQLFVGMHPFAGVTPKYNKKGIDATIERMKNNITVFNGGKLMPNANSLDIIPNNYKEWYRNLFVKGERTPPPESFGSVSSIQFKSSTAKSSGDIELTLLTKFEFVYSSINYKNINGNNIYITQYPNNYSCILNGKLIWSARSRYDMLLLPVNNTPILIGDGQIKIGNQIKKYQGKYFISDNRLFVASNFLSEVVFKKLARKVIISYTNNTAINKNSLQVLDGFAYQESLGKKFLIVPNSTVCRIIHIKELEKYRIIDGKYLNNICMLLLFNNGSYNKAIIRFDKSIYDIRFVDSTQNGINFAVLDNGICARFTEDDKLELFLNKVGDTSLKIIKGHISNSMKLFNKGNALIGIDAGNVYQIKEK